MPYTVQTTAIDGVLMLEPRVFGDARGFFFESFNARDFAAATGVDTPFVQDNHSRSAQGVLRGLQDQVQHPKWKGVGLTGGEGVDVVVWVRPDSPTRGQWVGMVLSADNKRQMWVPPGLAHGFVVTSAHAEFLYKTTDYWYPEHERSLLWSDPDLAIAWPALPMAPLLAAKDAQAPTWAQTQADWG